jgi:hypothetical protein
MEMKRGGIRIGAMNWGYRNGDSVIVQRTDFKEIEAILSDLMLNALLRRR